MKNNLMKKFKSIDSLELSEIQASLEHTYYMMQSDGWTNKCISIHNILDITLKVKVEMVKFLADNLPNIDKRIPICVLVLNNGESYIGAYADKKMYYFDVCHKDKSYEPLDKYASDFDEDDVCFQIW